MENRRTFIKKSGLFLAASSLAIPGLAGLARKSKSPADNVVVTLYVDTSQIDKDNVNSVCNFGQAADISNEDYTIVVNVGDVIAWQGVSTNAPSTDIVHIQSINHHHGKKIFDQDAIAGDDRSHKASRKVLRSTAGEESFKYVLRFTVFNNGNRRGGIYQIDPVIQVH